MIAPVVSASPRKFKQRSNARSSEVVDATECSATARPGRPNIIIFQGKNLHFLLKNLDSCIKTRTVRGVGAKVPAIREIYLSPACIYKAAERDLSVTGMCIQSSRERSISRRHVYTKQQRETYHNRRHVYTKQTASNTYPAETGCPL